MASSRDRILAAIRTSLAKNRAMLEAEAARISSAPPPHVHPPQDDLAAQFAAELALLDGRAHRCAGDAAAIETTRAILRQHRATSIIGWDLEQIGLPGLAALLAQEGVALLDGHITGATGPERATRLQALEQAPVCISGAQYGIAESGTLVVLSGAGRGRLASLLAPVHIAVLRRAQLVRGLGEALALLQEQYGPDIFAGSSNLALISGPSRTGDIEQTLIMGVHGPRELHVVLIEG